MTDNPDHTPALHTSDNVDTVLSGLSVAAHDALDYLQSVTTDDTKPDALRVKAAGQVLGHFRAAASLAIDRANRAERQARYRAEGLDPEDPYGPGL